MLINYLRAHVIEYNLNYRDRSFDYREKFHVVLSVIDMEGNWKPVRPIIHIYLLHKLEMVSNVTSTF